MKYLSRKFIMNVGIIVTLFVFLWFGKVSDTLALPIIVASAGIYTGGNVAQKGVTKDKRDIQ